MTVDDILRRLERVKREGAGWEARCPAHEDNKNSLTIALGQDDRVLLNCHAGCEPKRVVEELGLTMADLFPAKPIRPNGSGRIVATYDYKDAQGRMLFQSVRWEPKDFRQRRPAPDGGWVYDLKNTTRVLYRLPELVAADPKRMVFIVEGEKDADNLHELGFLATTNPQGAGKWRPEYGEVLKGRNVVIIPDNDEPGRKHAAIVADALADLAASIKVITLPDLDPKGDVSDWLGMGHSKDDLIAIVRETPKLIIDYHDDLVSKNMSPFEFSGASKDNLSIYDDDGLVAMETVKPEVVKWLWHGRLPYGKLSVLDGDPGLGKSTMLLDIAARLTTGTCMPGETERPEAGSVLLLSAEDGLGDTIRPRLEAAGADLTKIKARTIVRDDKGERLPELTTDLATIATDIETIAAKLVVIDPFMAYLGSDVNSNKDQDIRRALAPLAAVAERTGAAVVIIRHLNKAPGNSAIYRGGGSIGIIGAVRSGLLVAKDTDDPTETRRILASTKNNLAPTPPSLAYRLLPSDRGVAYIQWEGETSHTATSLLAGPTDQSEKPAIAEASRFLRDLLDDGPKGVTEIKKEARQAGISDITLRRAKDILGVQAKRTGYGSSGFWVWEFPDTDEHLSNNTPTNDLHNNEHLSIHEHLYQEQNNIDAHRISKMLSVNDIGSSVIANEPDNDDSGAGFSDLE